MVASSGEVPTPLDSPVLLPLVKRAKQDASCPPAVPATECAGWSTLPGDLIRRIADSFLDTNDLDYYMCIRGICPRWRAATDDPSSDTQDSRFHPRCWIILDEDFQGDGSRVLVNTATGRFLHKKLPVLLDYYVVGTSHGFFVLADRSPPHAARVFNPLTGCMVCFTAPVPRKVGVGLCEVDSSLSLALFYDSSRTIYKAAPDSEGFLAHKTRTKPEAVYNCFRKAAVGGVYAEISALKSTVLAEMFLVLGAPIPFVFRVDMDAANLQPVESIGRFAIFISEKRCLAVDTDIFPSIEPNCVYFIQLQGWSAHICKSNIQDKYTDMKVERISENADFLKQGKQFVLAACRPLTVIQFLSSYTINVPDSQLPL